MTILNSAARARPASGGARTFVRRLYFYGMALISLIVALIAIDNLLHVLDQIWLGNATTGALLTVDSYTRNAIARSGGTLLVAAPIFLLHWGFVNRHTHTQVRDVEELHSGMRKFFLYAAALVAAIYTVFNAFDLLQGIAQLAMGMAVEQSLIWPTGWLHDVAMFAVGLALQIYFLRTAATDGDLGQEIGVAGTWRRLFYAASALFGLGLLIFGLVGLLDTLIHLLLGAAGVNLSVFWWRPRLGDHIGQTLLGALMLHLSWIRWQRLAVAYPQEAQSALRRFYLYVAVVGGALTVLLPLAQLVRSLLLAAFGYWPWNDIEVMDNFAMMLAAAPIGLYIWRWHWRFLQQEAASYGESAQGATIRRLYYYAVALTGLVLVWFGAIDLVQVALDVISRSLGSVGERIWVEPLATGLSRLLIAAPIWAFHWQVSQRVARRDDPTGRAERSSGPRKVYLYGVALAGGVIILYYLAQVAYRLLLVLLGDPNASFAGAEPVGDLARSAIAAVIWVVHVLAIRRDSQMGADAHHEETVGMAPDEQRAILEARINLLQMQLDEARAELAVLDQEQ
jgi:hypothetical protein